MKGVYMKWLVAVFWIACSTLDYGLIYGGLRYEQVNDWPETQGSRPGAYRSARLLAGMESIFGPFAIPAALMVQVTSDVPGWHVQDWPGLDESQRPEGKP